MARKIVCMAVGVAVGLALLATPAVATSEAATKIWFKLHEHEVEAGDDVVGTVLVLTKGRFLWWPLPKASLTISVDGVKVGSATTNFLGLAKIRVPAGSSGEHAIEVSYAGDPKHAPSAAAEAFTVLGEPTPGVPDAPVLDPVESGALVPGMNYLQWVVPVADNGSQITGYRVYRRVGGEPFVLLLTKGPAAFSADDVQVTSGTTYVYVVTAVNVVGESVGSNEVTITAL